MTAGNSSEKRLHVRVRFLEPVRANPVVQPERSWYLLAQDMSEGGLQLKSPESIAVGTRLLMDIKPGAISEPIHCIGEVTWVAQANYQDHYRIGVQLVEVSENVRQRLRELVAAWDSV